MFDLNIVDNNKIFRKVDSLSTIWIESHHDQDTKWSSNYLIAQM